MEGTVAVRNQVIDDYLEVLARLDALMVGLTVERARWQPGNDVAGVLRSAAPLRAVENEMPDTWQEYLTKRDAMLRVLAAS